MSAVLESVTGGEAQDAGIVFHVHNANNNFYHLSVLPGTDGEWRILKYVNGAPVQPPLASLTNVEIIPPVQLRVIRRTGVGIFDCYLNGMYLPVTDSSFGWGKVGFRVNEGDVAMFDNLTVHGQNAFLREDGSHSVLFEDPFHYLNIAGMPHMWGLRQKWEIVDMGDPNHGMALKGVQEGVPSSKEAVRGDRRWMNLGTGNYMNYSIEADIKLDDPDAVGGVCLRVKPKYYTPPGGFPEESKGDQYYECCLDRTGAPDKLKFRRRHLGSSGPDLGQMVWENIAECAVGDLGSEWHTLKVEARGDDIFKCYLNGQLLLDLDLDPPPTDFNDGLVGLWVDQKTVLFDNVKVLDLRTAP